MSGSSSSGSSSVVKGEYESNRGLENPQAQSLMDSVTGYLNNVFGGNSAQTQASNTGANALASVASSGGVNPYLNETIENLRQSYASDLESQYAKNYAENQGLGEATKQRILSDVVADNQIDLNSAILSALNDSWNAGQDRVVQAAGAATGVDPALTASDAATKLIANFTKEWGYQPANVSSESSAKGGIKA